MKTWKMAIAQGMIYHHVILSNMNQWSFFLSVVSAFVVSSSTYSDVESTKGSNETELADEVGHVYEMGDDDLCLSDDVGADTFSMLHSVPATPASLILFGPHRKLSGGEKMYEVKDKYEMLHDKKFVCALNK